MHFRSINDQNFMRISKKSNYNYNQFVEFFISNVSILSARWQRLTNTIAIGLPRARKQDGMYCTTGLFEPIETHWWIAVK